MGSAGIVIAPAVILPLQVQPCVLAYAHRARARAVLRAAFPRRKGRLLVTRTSQDFEHVLKTTLVDAVVIDLVSAQDDTWHAAAFAREFPSTPFFAMASLRAGDGPALAHCATNEFVDVLLDVVDVTVTRDLVVHDCFTTRFARALADPPALLTLGTPLQLAAWRYIVASAGRPVRTAAMATTLHVTREHLSRAFATNGAPNLKRVIDFVRLIVAAELAKNPGHDLHDVAHLLGFASSSHLSTTSQRVAGTKLPSLSRLRTVDLVDRFARGRGRSRG